MRLRRDRARRATSPDVARDARRAGQAAAEARRPRRQRAGVRRQPHDVPVHVRRPVPRRGGRHAASRWTARSPASAWPWGSSPSTTWRASTSAGGSRQALGHFQRAGGADTARARPAGRDGTARPEDAARGWYRYDDAANADARSRGRRSHSITGVATAGIRAARRFADEEIVERATLRADQRGRAGARRRCRGTRLGHRRHLRQRLRLPGLARRPDVLRRSRRPGSGARADDGPAPRARRTVDAGPAAGSAGQPRPHVPGPGSAQARRDVPDGRGPVGAHAAAGHHDRHRRPGPVCARDRRTRSDPIRRRSPNGWPTGRSARPIARSSPSGPARPGWRRLTLRRGARPDASGRAGARRSPAVGRSAGRDPVGQRHRARRAGARGDARRRAVYAGRPVLFAALAGPSHARRDLVGDAARPGLRRRRGAVRAGARQPAAG